MSNQQPIIQGGTIIQGNSPGYWEQLMDYFQFSNQPGDVPIKDEIQAREYIQNSAAAQGIDMPDSFVAETEGIKKAWDNSPAGQKEEAFSWLGMGLQRGIQLAVGAVLLVLGVVVLGRQTIMGGVKK